MDTTSRAWDERIARRRQSGETNAFEDLVHAMERSLLYCAAKLQGDGERVLEALQESWIRMFRGWRLSLGYYSDIATARCRGPIHQGKGH
jgi:hypothetical protein